MITPGGISDPLAEADEPRARRSRSSIIKLVSVVTAILITAALLIGFMVWRRRHEESVATTAPQAKTGAGTRPALPARLQVFMDEPVRKGPQAIISGTVQNISNESLSNLSVEVELAHRKDAGTEVRMLEVEPRELAANQKGRYSLTLTGDYRSIKLRTIKAGADSSEVGFKTAPGTPRPVERPHETKTIVVERPSSAPRQGEEFINTPDNPAKIP